MDNPNANQCPKCQSTQLEGGFVEVQPGTASQTVYCVVCDHDWIDTYTLDNPEALSLEVRTHSRNYLQNVQKAPDPLPNLLAVACEGFISLTASKHKPTSHRRYYRVVYGLQSTDHRTLKNALHDFTHSIQHSEANQ